jgi:hypothetical protein
MGVIAKKDEADYRRLQKLRDDQIWNDGRKMTRAEVFRLLEIQYPRLHEVMFKPARTARHRAWEKQYKAEMERRRDGAADA